MKNSAKIEPADLKLLGGAARRWLSSGTGGMLGGLVQLRLAGLEEEKRCWLPTDWEKSPGGRRWDRSSQRRSSLKHALSDAFKDLE